MRLPQYIEAILETLHEAGFEAFVVGGAVRHLALGEPAETLTNWDLASNAKPEEVQALFPKSFYENKFGTVTVVVGREAGSWELETSAPRAVKSPDEEDTGYRIQDAGASTPGLVEITPYRLEGQYSNKRHPDEVVFTDNLDEDLARRDFTINAMALGLADKAMKLGAKGKLGEFDARLGEKYVLHDPFGGLKDLKARIVRAVREPEQRFDEDALRLLRAARFATTLDFEIEPATKAAVQKLAPNLKAISAERVRDEFSKIILARSPDHGVILLKELGLLEYIMPELLEGVGIEQRGPHRYDVFKHNTLALKFAAQEGGDLGLRLAALLHDVAKPATRAETPEHTYTFYGHNVVGAKMAKTMLKRLKFPAALIERVRLLVYHHLFFYDVDVVTESSVRRLLVKVGKENIKDLIALRLFDRQSTPVPKRKPYKLRHLEYMIDKVSADPITVTELKIDGGGVMTELKIEPGPRIGLLLKALLGEVLEYPALNEKSALVKRLKELNSEPEAQLKELGSRVEKEKIQQDEAINAKHFVR